MTFWRHGPFGILLIAGMALAGWGILAKKPNVVSWEELRVLPRADQHWVRLAESTLPAIIEKTRFKNSWTINPVELVDGTLNLFVVDLSQARASASQRRYLNNCAYTGQALAIVCDINLFERFLERLWFHKVAVVPPGFRDVGTVFPEVPAPVESRDNARRQMMRWVIGHEIGHVESNDAGAHFAEEAFFRETKTASVSHQRETAADSFVIQKLDDPLGRDKDFYDFLFTIVNLEIRLRSCPDRSVLQDCPNIQYGVGLPPPAVDIAVRTSGSHPEYIVRLLNILEAAGKHKGLEHVDYLARQILLLNIKER